MEKKIIDVLQHETMGTVFKVVLIVIFGFFAAHFVARLITKTKKIKASEHERFVWGSLVYWMLVFSILMLALHLLGFHINVLIGLMSILGLTIGFAGQASVGNLVAGIFLLFENRIRIKSIVEIDQTMGHIESLGFLAINIRTFDNALVRVSNLHVLSDRFVLLTTPDDLCRFFVFAVFDNRVTMEQARQNAERFASDYDYCDKNRPPSISIKYCKKDFWVVVINVLVKADRAKGAHWTIVEDVKKAFNAEEVCWSKEWWSLSAFEGRYSAPFASMGKKSNIDE